MGFNIAIDGPAGAGKSTVAKTVAKDLGYIYVDTGAMYRSIGLYLLRKGADLADEKAVESFLPEIEVTIGYLDGVQQIYLNQENVSGLIRTQEVGEAASKTSAYKAVRAKLLSLQREMAEKNDVLMDGRDIGTAVLPQAQCKIYLTASSYVRAKRRYDELVAKGEKCDFDAIKAEIEERDFRDMNREIAPLKQAEDAIYLDTSDMNIEQVVEAVKQIAEAKK